MSKGAILFAESSVGTEVNHLDFQGRVSLPDSPSD